MADRSSHFGIALRIAENVHVQMFKAKHLIALVCAAAVIALWLCVWRVSPKEEMMFQARPVRSWVTQYTQRPNNVLLQSPRPSENDPLLRAVLEIGTNAVPFLLEARAVRTPVHKRLYRWIFRRSSTYYTDRDVDFNVAFALRLLGRPAIPAVARGLRSENWRIRQVAATALGDFESAADEVVPLLIDSLASPDFRLWGAAADALGRLGIKARAAVPPLLKRLQSGTSFIELYMPMIAIGKIQPGNESYQAILSNWAAATSLPGLSAREMAFLKAEAIQLGARAQQ